jgi:scyllo-inositol 2-dehydrogenase (NADP+)
MTKIINVGLAGFGLSGRVFHAPFINIDPNFKLLKVLERSSEKSKLLYPDVSVVNNFDSLLENTDLIVITTPNIYHFEMAQAALNAGKHVIIEKPFTTNVKEADQLIKIAAEKNRILSVYHNRRFDGDFLTVKKIIENKLLGELVEYEVHFDRFRNKLKENAWREEELPGSGILFDLGSHMIDQAVSLFGLPETVTADIRRQRPLSKVDDNFELCLEYKSLKVVLKAGMLVREPGPHFILHGTEGSFVKYGMDPQEELLKKGASPLSENWGTEAEEQWGTLNTSVNGLHYRGKVETIPGSYADYYSNIYDVIINKNDLTVKPEQARETIRIIEAAFESNKNKAPFKL